jgi:Ni2+-binding GTPase involved in maturation of urease and hydrogenase
MIQFIALGGFLGAGKTTTMMAAAQRMRTEGQRVVVVTNDQGVDLVDTAVAARELGGVGEVTGGCFCCRFDDLEEVVARLVEKENPDVVLAESVGSCTDLTATVIRPLMALHGAKFTVAPLTTVIDPLQYLRLLPELGRGESSHDLAYLYRKQLEDAAIIAINKVDLLKDEEITELTSDLSTRFPNAEVVTYSAARAHLQPLCAAWAKQHDAQNWDLDLDYLRYGVAEARLAWLNQTYAIESGGFVPAAWACSALESMARSCRDAGYTVGHIKITVEDVASNSLTKASLIGADRPVSVDLDGAPSVRSGRAMLNGRVECEPEQLEEVAASAVRTADAAHGARSAAAGQRSFKPGQPRPIHRIRVGA